MAIHYNVKTVTDGLVLALDAANPKSYSDTGNTWRDLSGNGNNGTLVGGVGYNAANGGSLTFNGSNHYINLPDSDNWFFSTGNFTAEIWVYPTASPNQPILVGQWDGFGGGTGLSWVMILSNNSSRYLRASISSTGSGVDFDLVSSTSLALNGWNHCAFVRNGSTFTLYLNGNSVASTTNSAALFNATNPLIIGASSAGTLPFNGRISNVKIYKNKGLTAAEVLQNYNALKSRYIAAPSIPTPTLPIIVPNYEQLTYIISGNLTATGNGTTSVDIFKTSGSDGWDNQAYSTTAFSAPCTIEFNKQAASTDNGVSYAMIGWNEDPTANASYDSLDYTSYPYMTNSYNVYHNGSAINPGTSWNSALKLYVVYGTDGFIRHYNGSTLLYSVNYGTGRTVYVDSSFFSVNSTFGGFSNIKVIRSTWNGASYA
jgi:hypothetical protein